MYLPKPIPYSVVWSNQPKVIASMWMQIKQSLCVLYKKGTIAPSGKTIESVDQFTYFCSNISSTEKDVNIPQVKVWTAIDILMIIYKSDLSDKINQRDFFQAVAVSVLLYGCTTWTWLKRIKKKLDGNYTRMLRVVFNKSSNLIPTNSSYIATYLPSLKQFKLDKQDIQGTAEKGRMNT